MGYCNLDVPTKNEAWSDMYERGLWGQSNTHEILVFGVSVCAGAQSSSLVVGKELFAMPGANILHLYQKSNIFSPPFISLKQKKQ